MRVNPGDLSIIAVSEPPGHLRLPGHSLREDASSLRNVPIYADLTPMAGFAENAFVGRKLQIGTKAVIAVTDRDPRCKMITLDPKTAEASPEVLRTVRDSHEGKAGLYGAVLVEGTVRPGDEIRLFDR